MVQLVEGGQQQSASRGGCHRSVSRRQRACRQASRGSSLGRPRKPQAQRPPEEVQLRPSAAEEETTEEDSRMSEHEQDLTIVNNLISDWVDTVATELLEEEFSLDKLPRNWLQDGDGELEDELWEAVSTASFEDMEEGEFLDFEPPANEMGCIGIPAFTEAHASPTAVQAEAPQEEQAPPPSPPVAPQRAAAPSALGEDVVPSLAASPAASPPQASPSSRSSTPSSRSVRHRRRIIGGVVRPSSSGWDAATACQRQVGQEAADGAPQRLKSKLQTLLTDAFPPSCSLKHSASASALALDLGADAAESRWAGAATPASTAGFGRGQLAYRFAPGAPAPTPTPEQTLAKSKSLGALQITSSKHGLGLAPPMVFSKHGGLLPALSEDQGSKAEMIAWSVSMGRKKRSSVRAAF